MTTISKEYRCSQEREDTLRVVVYTGDQDAALNINGGETIILGKKKIRKLIKQLKKALPKKARKEKSYAVNELSGNVAREDTVRIVRPDMADVEGVVVNTDYDDHFMPLFIRINEGPAYWPAMGETPAYSS